MTTVELKTSIAADLDFMSAEMLESVSRYVKHLRRRSHPVKGIGGRAGAHPTPVSRIADSSDTLAGLEISPRVMQFKRGKPWYATDEEVDSLRQEYLMKKYK